MKPLMLGYLNARGSATPRTLRASMDRLARYAAAEGYALGHVFVEPDNRLSTSALPELIACAVRSGAAAVGVPTPEDLGRDDKAQTLLRQRIERDTCLRVLIISRPP